MPEYLPFMWGMQFLLVSMTAYIFGLNYEGGGVKEGLRFGVLFGLLFAIMAIAPYAYMPIPFSLAAWWALGGLVNGIGLGIVFGFIYKKIHKNSTMNVEV